MKVIQKEYDFSDVLLKPQLTTKTKKLDSRAQADVRRTFAITDSRPYEWSGVPIIAANMDTIGTFEMAESLFEYGLCTALHKHYSVDDLVKFFTKHFEDEHLLFYTMGINEPDFAKFFDFCDRYATPKNICIDVANGYMSRFPDAVSRVREAAPDSIIMAGNVVCGTATYRLIEAGASVVKIGIGSGCFAPGQLVKTNEGLKAIENIKIGDMVLTHKGRYMPVTNTFIFNDKEEIIKINGIEATPNHEFYVLHKDHREVVNDDNIHEYAEWISLENITKDYLLLKHK